ncbi:unnamed protein product, partial [Amoebophrya sp. A25]
MIFLRRKKVAEKAKNYLSASTQDFLDNFSAAALKKFPNFLECGPCDIISTVAKEERLLHAVQDDKKVLQRAGLWELVTTEQPNLDFY